MISAIIADFSTMLILPFVIAIATGKKSTNFLYSLIIIAAFVSMYFIGKMLLAVRFIRRPVFGASQWEIRAAFALILIFVTISELVDIEIILGAFLAGILFSLFFQRYRSEILPKLDAIGYGLLIPVFFIISAYIVKVIPSFAYKKYFSWRETIGAGFLLSSNLSLTIAIAFIALKEGIITESLYSTFLLFAIFTCIISPMKFFDIFL